MATREELLEYLWKVLINAHLRNDLLDDIIKTFKRDPNDPFADTAPAIERLLAAGASRRDLSLVLRYVAYEAVFGTLYAINDPGVDNHDVFMLHEHILMADPSGMDGRPGSADAV